MQTPLSRKLPSASAREPYPCVQQPAKGTKQKHLCAGVGVQECLLPQRAVVKLRYNDTWKAPSRNTCVEQIHFPFPLGEI